MSSEEPKGRPALSESRRKVLKALQEEKLGVSFKELRLLDQALTHRSYSNEHPSAPHNERLELLGDAVLSLVVVEKLYQTYPEAGEGELSSKRSFLVSDRSVSEWARRLDLGAALRLGKGERGSDVAPGILEDALESVCGALFLDKGIGAVGRMLKPLIDAELEHIEGASLGSPKNRLQEHLQKRGKKPPVYRLDAVEGPDHRQEHVVSVWLEDAQLGSGRGSSRKRAEEGAARQALEKIESSEKP